MKKILHNAWGPDSLFSIGAPWLAHLHHAGQNSHRNTTWRQASNSADQPGPPKPALIWSWSALADLAAESSGKRFPPNHPQGTDCSRLPPVSQCTQHVNRQPAGGEEDRYLTHTIPSPVTPGPPLWGSCAQYSSWRWPRRTTFDSVTADFL